VGCVLHPIQVIGEDWHVWVLVILPFGKDYSRFDGFKERIDYKQLLAIFLTLTISLHLPLANNLSPANLRRREDGSNGADCLYPCGSATFEKSLEPRPTSRRHSV